MEKGEGQKEKFLHPQGNDSTLPCLIFPLAASSAEKMLECVTGTTPHRQEPVYLCSLRGLSSMGLAFLALGFFRAALRCVRHCLSRRGSICRF